MKLKYQLNYERQFADMMCELGMHCERVAGSGMRENSVCDCILINKGKTYLVEIKATKENKFPISKHTREQLERLIVTASNQYVTPLLVIRFKRRGWNFIKLTAIPKRIDYDPSNDWMKIMEG